MLTDKSTVGLMDASPVSFRLLEFTMTNVISVRSKSEFVTSLEMVLVHFEVVIRIGIILSSTIDSNRYFEAC